ncbi:SoxR reducing system RseC family protein [Rhodocyclus tenuis]|uniref:SoxR reducing system RseC family protein n=1 Tax=Rhodocyclus tenuis TaxID=1066 RepID=UPI0019049A71|nr:SoxR reducing system RseC family protein [Rhodocyclus tenuis]MBK1678873.1 hypothetical protein [Rhodocyclus tenuis]
MHEASGTIVALDGDFAIVRLDASGGCGRCHEPGGCGGGANIGRMLCSSESRDFRALNPECVPVGASIRLAIADGAVRRSAVLAYGIPLVALFAGALAGGALAGEAGSIGGALAGIVAGWFVLRRDRKVSAADPAMQPVIRPASAAGRAA